VLDALFAGDKKSQAEGVAVFGHMVSNEATQRMRSRVRRYLTGANRTLRTVTYLPHQLSGLPRAQRKAAAGLVGAGESTVGWRA
jgi:hypothetical protein